MPVKICTQCKHHKERSGEHACHRPRKDGELDLVTGKAILGQACCYYEREHSPRGDRCGVEARYFEPRRWVRLWEIIKNTY